PNTRIEATTQRQRSFQFEYKATIKDIPVGAHNVELWIPVPHDSAFQKITDLQIESPYPYRTYQAQYGNKLIHVSLSNPKESSFTVMMRFNAVRKEHIQEPVRKTGSGEKDSKGGRDSEMARWLQPDRLVPIDGRIKQWAQEVIDAAGAKTDLEKV